MIAARVLRSLFERWSSTYRAQPDSMRTLIILYVLSTIEACGVSLYSLGKLATLGARHPWLVYEVELHVVRTLARDVGA
jgi:hypothetical protein